MVMRFAEPVALLKKATPENTKKATKYAVKIFDGL